MGLKWAYPKGHGLLPWQYFAFFLTPGPAQALSSGISMTARPALLRPYSLSLASFPVRSPSALPDERHRASTSGGHIT
jgi:hypothetical protein